MIRFKFLKFLVHSCNPMRRGGSFSIICGFNILLMLVGYIFMGSRKSRRRNNVTPVSRGNIIAMVSLKVGRLLNGSLGTVKGRNNRRGRSRWSRMGSGKIRR